MRDDIYWAAEPKSEDVVTNTLKRIRAYRLRLRDSGRSSRMKRAWSTYYGYSPDASKDTSYLGYGGKTGELVNMAANHFAGLVEQAVVLTTSARPTFKAIASNTDYSSMAQAHLAEGLNEYYSKDLGVADREIEATRMGVLLSEGYVALSWNPAAGEKVMVGEDGRPVSEGQIETCTLTPFDVAYDTHCQDWDSLPWVAFRKRVPRWDLIATYPAVAEEIKRYLTQSRIEEDEVDLRMGDAALLDDTKNDMVWVWELRHKPTPALPNGRLLRFLSPECVLFDSVEAVEEGFADHGYNYEGLMVERITPGVVAGTMAGHTPFFDLISLQEAIDMVASAAATNINAGAVQNIYCKPGANFSVDEVAGGLNLISAESEPVPITLTKVSPESISFAQMCIQWMRQRVALNDVVMGEPQKGMPAQAMALLHAQAIQFHSNLQESYQKLVERVRTGIIKLLKKYANTKRVALIAGRSNTYALKEFSAQDIQAVARVSMESINPASRTIAGRMAMADKLLDQGMLDREQYIAFMETGRLDRMYEAKFANLMRLQRDIEMLQQGVGIAPVDETGQFVDDGKDHVMPLATDTHWVDIPEMLSVLNTPEARNNVEVQRAVLDTVAYKMDLWRNMDPGYIEVQGGRPCPPKVPAAQLMGGPPGVGGPPANDQAANDNKEGEAQQAVKMMADGPMANLQNNSPNVSMPQMPKPPKNPIGGMGPGPGQA